MRAAREGTHEQVIAEDESIAREVGVTVLSLHWVAAGIASGAVEGCPVDL